MYDIDLTNDFVFRHIFGDERNSDLLLSLVNAVLAAKGLPQLAGIVSVNPFLPINELTQREGILDVRAVDDQGRHYDIEIQVSPQEAYIPRSIYYLCRMYGGQLERAADYRKLEPCVSISILDFNLFKDSLEMHHYFTLRCSEDYGRELSRDLSLHYLELPKVKFPTSISSSMIEKWLYLMKRINNPEDSMVNDITSSTPELERAKEAYTALMTDEQKRMEALAHEMWVRDQIAYRREAEERGFSIGLEKGMKQGIEQGRKQALHALAEKLKASGMTTSQIIELTGLSETDL